MIEGGVPPHSPGELLSRVKAQGQGRNRGAEDIASDSHQAVSDCHRPECREGQNNDRCNGQYRQRQDDDAALGTGLVDRGPNRCLDRDAKQAAEGRYKSDFGLTPMLPGDQEDIEIRPDRAAYVG